MSLLLEPALNVISWFSSFCFFKSATCLYNFTAWNALWRGRVRVKPFTDSFYGWIYKILRTALLMVGRVHVDSP